MIFAAIVRRFARKSVVGVLLAGCAAVLAAPVPAQGQANGPIVVADAAMQQAGLGDCLPASLPASMTRQALAAHELERRDYAADRDDVAGLVCEGRLALALQQADTELAGRLVRGLLLSHADNSDARGWLAVTASEVLLELGEHAAARSILSREAGRLGEGALARRVALLQELALLQGLPDAELQARLAAQQPATAADAETRLIGLRHLSFTAEDWGELARLADGASLHQLRFAIRAAREQADLALDAGEVAQAQQLLVSAMVLASLPDMERQELVPLGNLDSGLGHLIGRAMLAQGADVEAVFPRTPLGGEPVEGGVYADWAIPEWELAGDRGPQLLNLYRAIWDARGSPPVMRRPFIPDLPQLPSAAFMLAQELLPDPAGDAAMLANAVRQEGDPAVRESLSVAADLFRQRDELLALFVASPPDAAAEVRLAQDLRAIENDLRKLGEAVNAAGGYVEDPLERAQFFYTEDAVHPWYLAQRQANTEAFLMIVPADGDLHVFAVGHEEDTSFAWHHVPGGVALVDPLVQRLRCQVDADSCTAEAILSLNTEPVSALEDAGQPAFDMAAAHRLYQLLFAPVERVFAPGDDIFVMARGSMASLPLSALVTQPPAEGIDWADYAAMRDAPWLGDRYAFTTVPSLASFRPNRLFDLQQQSEDVLFAVVNPAFSGSEAPGDLRSARLFSADARGALANLEAIRQLAALPGTQRELDRLVGILAPQDSVVLQGALATETALKGNARLRQSRNVLLATHGLLPRQNRWDIAQPALVLTPPQSASSQDDGLLTAGEVRQLDLAAAWVILSACNTATGNGEGESLSALASAFLSAGALQVMASHWPVRDDVTPYLTSETLRLASEQSDTGPGRALQQAMRHVRTGEGIDGWQPDWAHPAAWAPFTVISNGDEAVITGRFELLSED